jgi:hypothetical protein
VGAAVGAAGAVAGLDRSDRHPAGTDHAAHAPHEPAALALEALDGDGVVPVVGGVVADALGDEGPVGLDGGVAGQARHPPRLGQQVGGPHHHLRRHAPPVGALAAEELPVDADHVEPGLGQRAGHVLAAGAHAHHDHVHGLDVLHALGGLDVLALGHQVRLPDMSWLLGTGPAVRYPSATSMIRWGWWRFGGRHGTMAR